MSKQDRLLHGPVFYVTFLSLADSVRSSTASGVVLKGKAKQGIERDSSVLRGQARGQSCMRSRPGLQINLKKMATEGCGKRAFHVGRYIQGHREPMLIYDCGGKR